MTGEIIVLFASPPKSSENTGENRQPYSILWQKNIQKRTYIRKQVLIAHETQGIIILRYDLYSRNVGLLYPGPFTRLYIVMVIAISDSEPPLSNKKMYSWKKNLNKVESLNVNCFI